MIVYTILAWCEDIRNLYFMIISSQRGTTTRVSTADFDIVNIVIAFILHTNRNETLIATGYIQCRDLYSIHRIVDKPHCIYQFYRWQIVQYHFGTNRIGRKVHVDEITWYMVHVSH